MFDSPGTYLESLYRFHIVQEFNKGVYDYIIASDESAAKGEIDHTSDEEDEAASESQSNPEVEAERCADEAQQDNGQ
jgi:ATP-dependent RNA helicase DDX56/DBP9